MSCQDLVELAHVRDQAGSCVVATYALSLWRAFGHSLTSKTFVHIIHTGLRHVEESAIFAPSPEAWPSCFA